MTELLEFMRPPDGEVIRSTVVFSRKTFNYQRAHYDNAWIEGPVGAKENRVMTKDILWAPRPSAGIGRNERAKVQGDVDVFSVLNGIGTKLWHKSDFLKRYYFIGLSTSTMESNAINTDAGIYSAVDRQGLTWIRNNGSEPIHVGDLVIAELPNGTHDARAIFPESAPREGGTPAKRYTAFTKTWSVADGIVVSKEDVNHAMRGTLDANLAMGSSPAVKMALRKIMVASLIVTMAAPGTTDDMADFARGIAARDGTADAVSDAVVNIMNGGRDAELAVLLFPAAGEYVVPGARMPRGVNRSTIHINDIQRNGYADLITALCGSLQESGGNRIMGRAVSGAAPGRILSILLFG